ncbi:MAG: hypothetical protein AAGU23_06690 [Bacillota bacterium]|nr:hypothetical protein [Bacillota bacterium]HWR56374.1 hypothetical protein [Negativicutes bacterium]
MKKGIVITLLIALLFANIGYVQAATINGEGNNYFFSDSYVANPEEYRSYHHSGRNDRRHRYENRHHRYDKHHRHYKDHRDNDTDDIIKGIIIYGVVKEILD